MELCYAGQTKLKGKTEHHIVHHRYFGDIAVRRFLKDNTALGPLHLVKELPVLVVTDFKRCKGDLQGSRGTFVEEVPNGLYRVGMWFF